MQLSDSLFRRLKSNFLLAGDYAITNHLKLQKRPAASPPHLYWPVIEQDKLHGWFLHNY